MWQSRRPNFLQLFIIAVVAGCALVVFRCLLPDSARVNESFDYVDYYEPAARSLLNGAGLQYQNRPATKYPPGFPLFLAAHFQLASITGIAESTLLDISAVLCFSAATVLLFACARRLRRTESVNDFEPRWYRSPEVIVTALWIVYPPGLWLFKQPNSELPFVACLFATIRLFVPMLMDGEQSSPTSSRAVQVFLTGILCGLTSLIRPITIGMGCVMASMLWISLSRAETQANSAGSRRALKSAGILLLGNLLAVLPWELWVWQKTGRIVPLSTLGVQALYEGVTYGLHNDGTRNTNIRVPDDLLPIMNTVHSRVADGTLNSFGDMTGILSREFQRAPMSVLKLYALKAGRAWIGTDSGRMENVLFLIQVVWLTLFTTAIVRQYIRNQPLTMVQWFLILLTLYFWGLVTLTFSIARYMTPVMGLLLLATIRGPSLRGGNFSRRRHEPP